MSYRMNLDLSPRKFEKGGIELYLNWHDREDGDGTQPAMVFRRTHGDTKRLFIIKMKEMPLLVDSTGFGLLLLTSMSVDIAESLGFSRMDRNAAFSISDLILDYIDDMYDMPNDPPNQVEEAIAGPKAEMLITLDGETVMETEVAV